MRAHTWQSVSFLVLLAACAPASLPPTVVKPAIIRTESMAQQDAVIPPVPAVLVATPLDAISLNDIGIGTPKNIWQQSDAADIASILTRLTGSYLSPTLQVVVSKVLSAAGKAPANVPNNDSDPAAFFALRVQALAQMGDLATASQLLRSIPPKQYTPSVWRTAVQIPLLEGNIAKACLLHDQALEKDTDTTATTKTVLLCQLQEGNRAAAELTLGVLEEQASRAAQRDVFVQLAGFGLDQPVKAPLLETPTALQIALLSLVQKDVPILVQPSLNPALYPRLANLPFLWSGTRILAAEQAVSRNTTDVATLIHFYRSEILSESEWGTIDDVLALGKLAMDEPLPTGRENALLWQKIQKLPHLEEKLTLLAALTPFNTENHTTVAFAKVFYSLLRDVPVSKNFMPHAKTIIPLLLTVGDADRANAWFQLLEVEEQKGNIAASKALAALYPHFILRRDYALTASVPLNVTRFSNWMRTNPVYGRAATTYLRVLNKPLPTTAPLSLLRQTNTDSTIAAEMRQTHGELLAALSRNSEGESLLLAARLVQLLPQQYDDVILGDVLQTFIKFGQQHTARQVVEELVRLE